MVSIKPSDSVLRYVGNGIYMNGVAVEKDDTFRFDCLRCGKCCEWSPGVNPKEASRMAQYMQISRAELFKGYLTLTPDDTYGWKVKVDKIGDNCAFYSKENGKASCKVNPAKPRQCRAKPIARMGSKITAEGIVPDLMFEPCRGFGRGREYTVGEWISIQKLDESWAEELDYFHKVETLKLSTPASKLKERISELFLSE